MTIRDIVVRFGFDVDRSSEKAAQDSVKGIKSMASKLLSGIAVVFSTVKLSGFMKDCAQAASAVQEMENKFDVVFDDMREQVDQWAGEFAEAVGRNKNAIKTYLADQQNLLVGFGMTRAEGAELAKEMTSLALDIASFANQDEDVAVNAMTKAVMGESEAAKTLGAVLNDTTRAETMLAMGLSGTYSSLDQLTKMQVNYNTILRQSPDAVGDCVRSMDSYEARTRQLNAAVAEFKEFIGGQLLPVFSVFTGWMTKGVRAANEFAKVILLDKEENNRLLITFERIQAVIKRLSPAMERFAASMRKGISRASDTVKAISARFGGMENVLKIITVAAGAFLLAMNWGKVVTGAKAFVSLLTGIGKMIGAVRVDILAAVAVITILALIVEDFIHFLLGNDSVIGTIFDRMGIGADNARQAVFDAFGKIKAFFINTWQELKSAVEKHGGSIRQSVSKIFGGIVTVARGIFRTLLSAAGISLGALGKLFGNLHIDLSTPINAAVSVFDSLLGVLGSLGGFLMDHSEAVEKVIKAYAAFKMGTVIVQLTKLAAGFTVATAAKVKDAAETLYINALYAKDFVAGIAASTAALAKQAVQFTVNTAAKAKDIAETVYLNALYAKDFVVSLAGATAALVKQAAQFAVNTAAKAADTVAQGAMTAATVAWNIAAAAATTVTAAFGAAMAFLTSPIGLVILAIAGLIAAGVLLYKHWDEVRAFAVSIWGSIVSFLQGAWETIKMLFETASGAIKTIWEAAWNGIKSFFSGILDWIESRTGVSMDGVRTIFTNVLNIIKTVFSTEFENIRTVVSGAFEVIKTIVSTVMNVIKGIIGAITSAIHGDWKGVWENIRDIISAVWNGISNMISTVLSTIWDVISNRMSAILSIMQSVWENIKILFGASLAVVQEVWNTAWEAVSSFFQGIWNGIVSFLQGMWTMITGVVSEAVNNIYDTIVSVLTAIHDYFSSIFSAVASFVGSTFSNIHSGVSDSVGRIKDTIVNGFNAAVDFIKGLPPQAVQWGADFIGGLKDGILSGVQGVVDAVRGVGEKIRSYLHFSVPDVGPLTDYESWMPDFMEGLAEGISENEDTVLDRIRSLAGSIRTLMSAATAKAATVAAGTVSSTSSSVTQNVNIENSYTGGSADAQRNVPRAMKKSAADATTQMARALAYARG